MTKKELIRAIAKRQNISIVQTEEFYNAFEQVLFEAIAANDEVILSPSIGTFALRHRQARLGRNPQTGEQIEIPEKTAVVFRPSRTIKEEVRDIEL
ncbi:Bacterial nucleoid DNA-binding protein [Candidatus Phytoplasma australiense]|uniref:Bacterial nucleoid DNA-binding protein n=1 Tax=Phytoplasma australiense TaxID=59748 RepID=B1V9P3_PHYAS|nr:Bacterial nucleoid DNA-binding protein [Candidatus Phytoplasma australiense]CAM11731.1 Bacterial nucleoid DNA-binding protein [Candidatus Phytoplasma australiense]